MKKLFRILLLISVLLSLLAVYALAEDSSDNDWPRWRGQNMNGKATQTDVFKFELGYGLKLNWKKPLGSGYSSISIADGRAVTMYSDSTFDYVVALDIDTGNQLWSYKIDSTYIGHDGSHNGQISTPTIDGNHVFVYARKGQLIALNAETGQEIWSRNIKNEIEPFEPFHGFGSSPVVVGDVLFCQTGGTTEHTFCGFNKTDGELLWSAASDTVNYQSPIYAKLLGEEQLVSVTDNHVYGLNPISGEILWQHRYNGQFGSTNPLVIDDDRIFLDHSFNESSLIRLKKEDGKYSVEEVWRNRNIRQTYSSTVLHDGYLYSYSGRFLTCVDANTGETVWKSRSPGDGFIILVDDHLVIITKQGTMHVAEASPQDYMEMASLKVFDGLTWNPPSFANGSIYARNLYEIARVDIAKVDQLISDETREEVKGVLPNTRFAAFVKKVESTADKKSMIDDFMAKQKSFPIIEADKFVHIVYRGEVKDLAINGDLMDIGLEHRMNRVADTDLYYYSAQLEPDAVVSYQIVKDFDERISDPLNPSSVTSFNGANSMIYMPKSGDHSHLNDLSGLTTGKIDTFHFESKIMESSRKIEVYLPAGYESGNEKYPTVYTLYGQQSKDWGLLANTLDNLIGKRVRPVIAVFIHTNAQAGSGEYYGDNRDKYAKMLAEELVPHIDEKYRTQTSPESRLLIGASIAGYNAVATVLQHPTVFGKMAGQSINIDAPRDQELADLVSNYDKLPVEFYLHWGKYDFRSEANNLDRAKVNRKFVELLKEKDYVVYGGEFNDGYGFPSWRTRNDDILEAFFPAKTTKK